MRLIFKVNALQGWLGLILPLFFLLGFLRSLLLVFLIFIFVGFFCLQQTVGKLLLFSQYLLKWFLLLKRLASIQQKHKLSYLETFHRDEIQDHCSECTNGKANYDRQKIHDIWKKKSNKFHLTTKYFTKEGK